MIDRVLASVARHGMLPRGARVVVAVSGGADSVCLLHILREIGGNVAGVAHFNHKLRGEESDEDERFAAALASRLDLPFYRSQAPPGAGNVEQEARRDRRDFFLGLIRDGACERIALGHTRDDQAETVLFRILRGSGLAGLAGIHPVTGDGFVRPLIEVSREEVRDFLRSRGIGWREDSSNRDSRFARNRIRAGLLPQLRREWNPRIDEALAQLADLAFEEERWWRSGASPVRGAVEMSLDELKAMPRAIARRTVRAAMERAKGDLRGIEFQHVEEVLGMKPGKLRLPGLVVTRSFSWVRFGAAEVRAIEPVQVIIPGTYDSFSIRLEMRETPDPGCVNLKVEQAAPLVLRGWRPGDHYRPVGKSRDQKLKEMFQLARIPSWRRAAWPILESEGKILWARGFGPAAEFNVAAGLDRWNGPVLGIWDLGNGSQT